MHLDYINKLNRKFLNTKNALIILFSFFAFAVKAQEIIKEKQVDSVKVKLPQSRQKADGIIATVGEYMVLDSDIDKAYLYQLIEKSETLIDKKIRAALYQPNEFTENKLKDVGVFMKLMG